MSSDPTLNHATRALVASARTMHVIDAKARHFNIRIFDVYCKCRIFHCCLRHETNGCRTTDRQVRLRSPPCNLTIEVSHLFFSRPEEQHLLVDLLDHSLQSPKLHGHLIQIVFLRYGVPILCGTAVVCSQARCMTVMHSHSAKIALQIGPGSLLAAHRGCDTRLPIQSDLRSLGCVYICADAGLLSPPSVDALVSMHRLHRRRPAGIASPARKAGTAATPHLSLRSRP